MDNKKFADLYREAYAFFKLSKNALENQTEYVEGNIPYITNISFACELYLKLILLHNGYSIDDLVKISHSLYSLYNALTQSQKDEIYNTFRRPLVYKIDYEIQRMDTAFKDWRYLVLDKANSKCKANNFADYFALELVGILDGMAKKIVLDLNPMYINHKLV